MLFWPKLLTIAHAISISIHPYLPLYLSHLLGFSYSAIGTLLAVVLALQACSLGFWTVLIVDHRPVLHGFFMAFLTMVGTTALILILWIPPHASYSWSAALFCMFLEGIFFEPIGVLIDSAIIKILGDYKMLFFGKCLFCVICSLYIRSNKRIGDSLRRCSLEKQRQWGYLASGCMSMGIGWLLDDDHDFDTLMGTMLIGPVLLFLLSLSTNVQPADPVLLGVTDQSPEEDDDMTPLLKAVSGNEPVYFPAAAPPPPPPPPPPVRYFGYPGRYHQGYKPYSLFGEQLSHISEEDASMLQRMASNHANTSVKHMPASITSSTAGHSISSFGHTSDAAAREESIHGCCGPFRSPSRYWTTASTTANNIQYDCLFEDMPSLQLALMPNPSPETPMIVLAALFSSRHAGFGSDYDWGNCEDNHSRWSSYSMLLTMFLVGMASSMMSALLYIFLHDVLGLAMHVVGLVGMINVAAQVAAKPMVHWAVHRFHMVVITGVLHSILFACAFAYTWLQPNHIITPIGAVILQAMQGMAFRSIWLVAVRQVDIILLSANQHRRMMLRGKMSVLFQSLGPALGAILAGYLADAYSRDNVLVLQGFALVFKSAVAVLALSSVVAWGWSLSADD